MDEFFSNPTNFSIRLSVAQPLRKRKERGGTSGISRVTLTERPGSLLFWSAVIRLRRRCSQHNAFQNSLKGAGSVQIFVLVIFPTL